ncbi:MAG TPA: 50S ribosomal protein L25 [Candidatus Binataceae bacterium]|nr:50S ribosomal protein L25 [Candidatus Binataceae bacterium]
METGELRCETRAIRPKGLARRLRREGKVPAVLYGRGSKSSSIAVDSAELKARISSAAQVRIMRIKSETPELDGKHIIFKELQRAPVSGKVLHADFYEVDLKRPLRIEVPFKFTGRAAGVGEGGILQPLVRAVVVECLPLEIPESIEVDVTALGIHDVIHVSAVKFASNVKPIFDQDYAVVSVLPPTVAEVAAPAAAAAAEGAPVEGAPAEGAAAAPAEGAKEGAAPAAPGAKAPAAAGAKAPAAAAAKKAEPAPKK